MGRRSSQEEENHWPGFVDALSTIVMVVTFLLIILAVVIFVLSQSIARSMVESIVEQQERGGGDMQSEEMLSASGEFRSDEPPAEDPTDDPPVTAEVAVPDTAETEVASADTENPDTAPEAATSNDAQADMSDTADAPQAAEMTAEAVEPQQSSETAESDAEATDAPAAATTAPEDADTAEPATSTADASQSDPVEPSPSETAATDAPAQNVPTEATVTSDLELPTQSTAPSGVASDTERQLSAGASEDAATGQALTTLAGQTLTDVPEVSGEDIAARSRRVVDEEERIAVAAADINREEGETRVTQAATFLTIDFDPSSASIGEEASAQISEFLGEINEELQGRKITIWAFTDNNTSSISQSRRTAYYRALAARNELLAIGLEGDDISLEIRPSPTPEDVNAVRLVVSE